MGDTRRFSKKFSKGGWQSLFLYVMEPVKWPPVDEMSWDFACREQMGLGLHGKKFKVNSTAVGMMQNCIALLKH